MDRCWPVQWPQQKGQLVAGERMVTRPKFAPAAASSLRRGLAKGEEAIGEPPASSPTFPPAVLDGYLRELVHHFDVDDPFPIFVLLRDGEEGFGFYRWRHPDAELEELVQSPLAWPADMTVTLVAADGSGASLKIEKPRLQ